MPARSKLLQAGDNRLSAGLYAQETLRLWISPVPSLSPAQLKRARRAKPCPTSFPRELFLYFAPTVAASSTFASRKNFAASSGGVGLI